MEMQPVKSSDLGRRNDKIADEKISTMKTSELLREEAGVLRLLGTLITAGVPLDVALAVTGEEFVGAKQALDTVASGLVTITLPAPMKRHIYKGLEQQLEETGYFSGFVPAAISAGVELGRLEIVLLSCSSALERTAIMTSSEIKECEINAVNFFRIFGILCGSGCEILKTFKILSSLNLAPVEVVEKLSSEVTRGETISGAMRCFPDFFSGIDCASVDVGEQTGALPVILAQMATIRELMLLRNAPGSGLPLDQGDDWKLMSLMDFCLIGVLIYAGMPTLRTIYFMAENSPIPGRQAVYKDLKKAIEGGAVLSEAMARHPSDFSPYMIALVKAGEIACNLEDIMAYLVAYQSAQLLGIEPAIPLKTAQSTWK